MRAFKKINIEHLYKLTCRDLHLIFNNKYKKKLGTTIVTASKIFLTTTQINFLLTLNCRGKVVIGYLKKINKNKFVFVDNVTVVDEYITLDNLPVCKKCKFIIKKLLKNT